MCYRCYKNGKILTIYNNNVLYIIRYMKLYQLLQSFEFEELFPAVNEMYPNAYLHRDIFEKAFNMLCNIQPVVSKKTIRYELKEDQK